MAGRTYENIAVFKPLSILAGLISLFAVPVLAEQQGDRPYPGDLGQMIAAVLIFIVLLLVLKKWAWKPVITQLHNREKDISDTIDKAHKREEQSTQLLEQYQDQLKSIQQLQDKIVADAKKSSQEIHDRMLAQAREEARGLMAQARDEIEIARAETLRQMQDTTAGIAADLVKKLLDKNLSIQDHQKIVEESLKAMKVRSGEQD